MIGIYQDSIIDYLKEYSPNVKVTSKNLIIPCPFCEYKKVAPHYHMYISLEAPIFHCFEGSCNKAGILSKLFKKIDGKDLSEKFIDQNKIKEYKSKEIKLSIPTERQKIILPEINEDSFKLKSLYLKGRLKFSNPDLKAIKGLVFDVEDFIIKNNIKMDVRLSKVRYYLHSNFVGFLTENESVVVFRNIDETSDFRYFKLFIHDTLFLDYYKLFGGKYDSNHIVISEGIFDIFNEQIFDYTGLRNEVKLYAAGLSTSFDSLIKSIVFNEQIYRINVSVLADRGIDLEYFKKIKKYNLHIIDQLTVFYNKNGKDFGDSPVIPEKFIL
jgi:hypothetical protein